MKLLILLSIIITNLSLSASVEVKILTETKQSWDGTTLPELKIKEPKISILRYKIPPHTKLAIHKHPVINAGYLISGNLTVVSEKGDTLDLKAGDSIVELVDTWHYGVNQTDFPVEIVVFYIGSDSDKLTVKKD